MSKTFKTSVIFAISAFWLVLMRIIVGFLNIGDYLSDWLFSILVQIVGMGLIPLLLYKYWVGESPASGFFIKPKLPPVIYLLTLAVGVVVCFLLPAISAVWSTILQMIGYTRVNSAGTVYPNGAAAIGILAMELFTTAVLPGIFEEINYRGLGMQMLSEVEDDRMKIVFIGLLFGLGHQFIGQTGYAFVAGMILAYIVVKTRSIVPGMIIHFMNNASSVLSGFSAQTTGVYAGFREKINSVFFSNFFMVILFCILLTAILCLLLKLIGRFSREEIKEVPVDTEDYYYPHKTVYVDALFGTLEVVREAPEKRKTRWYEYAPLYGAAALMIATTIYTFVWGVG